MFEERVRNRWKLLLISYRAAQELGITVPETLLARATQIIR
jgi:hypothetical protein